MRCCRSRCHTARCRNRLLTARELCNQRLQSAEMRPDRQLNQRATHMVPIVCRQAFTARLKFVIISIAGNRHPF